MKIQLRHALRTDVDSAFRLCTEQKSQERLYAQLGGTDHVVRREGRAPNVRLEVRRRMPANPPAAIRRLVPPTNEVAHTEKWRAEGEGYLADIGVEIRGVPVKISGTKALQPEKGGCTVAWDFDVTSGLPLLGSLIASFAGEELRKSLEDETRALKSALGTGKG